MNTADSITGARLLRASEPSATSVHSAALFLLPLAMAFFTYYATSWRPAGRVNHGVPDHAAAAMLPHGERCSAGHWIARSMSVTARA